MPSGAADPDTLRRRFLGAPPGVTAGVLEHLTVVDYVHRFALVARDPVTGRGVAIARYEPAGPGTAEFAVVVAPAWRRAGLATVLILLLAKAAAERDMHTISACYLAGNRPIAALIQDAGALARQVIKQGISHHPPGEICRARAATWGYGSCPRGDRPRIPTLLYVLQR